jgi:uncharacterized repeat protein (TIGR03803 family)
MKSHFPKLFFLVFFSSFIFIKANSQCTEFYGLLSVGGDYSTGAIFKTDENGENLRILYNPVVNANGYHPLGDLYQASNGKYYGMTLMGGRYQVGTLFEFEPENGNYINKYDFNNANGNFPKGNLIQAKNGRLYGMTSSGGGYNAGVLFEFDLLNGVYTKKIDFNGEMYGSNPEGSLVLSSNGKLYGMTYSGGVYDKGVLFEFDPVTGSFVKKIDFDGEVYGAWPHGSLIQADDNKLYGMTSSGSVNDDGVIFEYDPGTDGYIKKIDFGASDGGKKPYGTLFQAANGKIYGMTTSGGTSNAGVIFEWNISSNELVTRVNMDGVDGNEPRGALIEAENGKMYGMTTRGGISGKGVLFEWDPVTNIYQKRHDFISDKLGAVYGSLCRGLHGKFYGMTNATGINNVGAIFEWDPATDTFKDLMSMQTQDYGNYLTGTPVQAPNGNLYGMAASGGQYNKGILFEWNPGENKYVRKLDLNGQESGTGLWGATLVAAGDYSLYGTTNNGGANDMGVLFEWNYHTNVLTKKIDFNGRENGKYPRTSLLKASNGKLYGMTLMGGEHDWGVLFEYDPLTGAYTKKFDFSNPLGYQPCGSLMQASNGKLYGMTSKGGDYDEGTIFEWDINTNSYTKKFDFDMHVYGSLPLGSLVQANNGLVYGMTSLGGSFGEGVLFQWDPETNSVIKILDFDGPNYGAQPDGGLMQAANGKLYGVTHFGGELVGGILFELDVNTLTVTKKIEFDQVYGSNPYSASLIEISKHTSSIRARACESYVSPSGRYVWTTSGIHRDTIQGSTCDSIIIVDLTINHNSSIIIHHSSCDSYVSPSTKHIWTESGIYLDTIPNAAGCDSIMMIYLTIHKSTSDTLTMKACDSYNFNGNILSSSGIYYDVIQNAMGCDSMIMLDLTILRSTSSTVFDTACAQYNFNEQILTTSGTYIDIIPNSAGCDSVITLHLQVDHVDTAVVQDRLILISLDGTADHQWIDCNNANLPMEGETHITFTAHKNGRYAVMVTHGVCSDTSGVYEVLGTGVTDPASQGITLYPNPTAGNFIIDLGRIYTEVRVTITRYDGEVIQSELIRNKQKIGIDLDEPPGIYMINVAGENMEKNFKVIKN